MNKRRKTWLQCRIHTLVVKKTVLSVSKWDNLWVNQPNKYWSEPGLISVIRGGCLVPGVTGGRIYPLYIWLYVTYIHIYICLVQPCFAPFCTYTIPYLHQTTLQKWIWLANVHLKIPKTGRVGASKVLKTVESCLHCSVSGSWPQTLTNYEELLEHWSKRTHSSTRGSSHFHLECGWSNLSQDESQETPVFNRQIIYGEHVLLPVWSPMQLHLRW